MNANDWKNCPPLKILLHYFKPHRKLFIWDMTCAFFIALIDLIFPLVSRAAMYQWLPSQKYRVFFIVMGIMVVAFFLRSLLYFVVCYWGHTFGIRVEADIRRDLYYHLQDLGFHFYDKNRTGVLMSRLTNDLFDITELSHHGPEDVFIATVTIVGAAIAMFTVEWRLALVILVLIPLFVVILFRRRKAMSLSAEKTKQKTGAINAEIESGLSGIRTAKAFAAEEQQRMRFDRANDTFKTAKREYHRVMGYFLSTMELFVTLLTVLIVAVGGWLIMDGKMNYIDLITFSLYITTFVNPVRKLANFAELFSSGFAGLRRFRELMATEPSVKDPPHAILLENPAGEIRVEDVCFTYDGDVGVLDHVNLHIAPGETVAIVGPSGGGKSTLCQLLPRFYDVTSGAIFIDGKDLRSLQQDSLRRSIGIVQQDVFLFADTVRENIRFGSPDATDEQVAQAAKKAEIYDDIMAMPHGFDTYVGERGALLSGGQKQRIAIARIFLKNPPVLILDEATSALDSITESRIQSAFDALAAGRTTLIIAHRLSTIRGADRILVIEDGRIIEQGTHRELLAQSGAYAKLWHTQNTGSTAYGQT